MRAEAVIWDKQLSRMKTPHLGAAFVAVSAALCRVGRRQNAAHRDFQIALTKLLALQSAQHPETKPLNIELDSFLIFTKPASSPPSPPTTNAPTTSQRPPAPPAPNNPSPVLDSTFGP